MYKPVVTTPNTPLACTASQAQNDPYAAINVTVNSVTASLTVPRIATVEMYPVT